MIAAALFLATSSTYLNSVYASMLLWFLAVVVACNGVLIWLVPRLSGLVMQAISNAAVRPFRYDPRPGILTGVDGKIHGQNIAAERLFGSDQGNYIHRLLHGHLANPDQVISVLTSRVIRDDTAAEEINTHQGVLRLSAFRTGANRFLWHIEASVDVRQAETGTSKLPVLRMDSTGKICHLNPPAQQFLGTHVREAEDVFPDSPPRVDEVNVVRSRRGPVPCVVIQLSFSRDMRHLLLVPATADAMDQPNDWSHFDRLPVPLLKLARCGEILASNQPARHLLGVEECVSSELSDLMEGLGRSIPDWLEDAAAGRGSTHSEILRIRRDDKEVFAQVTLNRASERGETVLIAVLNDATRFKSLEEQFVQSQKMQAIGQLAGGVAHDFNNLLTAITGHCDLLLLRHDQADTDYADLVQINQNANRAAALVSQLLAFSRKQTLRPEMMDMRDMLADLTHLLNRLVGERVSLSLTHDPDLWAIRADKRQLEQVIMNLVVNARDAMPSGGDIRIETRNMTLEKPLQRNRIAVAPGRYVSITVEDGGIGIPGDKLQKIFEPFFTTKRIGEGTGLGLSTAYGIVKQTGGFIFVDSQVNIGTRFQLILPAHDPLEIRSPAEPPNPKPLGTTGGVVLLVEDEAPVRAFASRALQMHGITVLEAETAEDALNMLSDDDLKVDLFLTDVVMPGQDGPTWVRKALESRPETQVVFMSGYAEETFGDTQAKIPNSVFLPKPFSLTELTEIVQRQLAWEVS